jgi:hypothetical protein
MTERSLWNAYRSALEEHLRAPSFKSEAAAVASYAEWVRVFCPEHADRLITIFAGYIASVPEERAA